MCHQDRRPRRLNPFTGVCIKRPLPTASATKLGSQRWQLGRSFEPDHVNSIIAAGRADLCALARPHLADPYWTLHAAAQLGYSDIQWPDPYLRGKEQLERNLAKAAALQATPPSSPEEAP